MLLNQVPEHYIAPMRINRSLRTRTTEYICTQLRLELNTLTASDITYLESKLREPYQSGAPIPCFLAEWTANLNDLARANQPIADFTATALLKGCFDGIREFTKCWLQMLQTFPVSLINVTAMFGGPCPLSMLCASRYFGVTLL